ncbi:6-carboxytetrahydropterin synthase [Streptomyces xiamenensis]|uniref:6-carboxytetrahydropterin synthase n=1 Tax=Streptomyces xiamenensis TaxID=408015 RepID=UPI0036E1EE2B
MVHSEEVGRATREYETGITVSRVPGGLTQEIRIVLEQTIPNTGDTTDPQPARQWIKDSLDGKALNTVLDTPPSMEYLARHIHRHCRDLLPTLSAVRVSPEDEEGLWVIYRPQDCA